MSSFINKSRVITTALALVTGANIGQFVRASEPDDLTHRAQVLAKMDATPTINAIVNQQIEGTINEFNRGTLKCGTEEGKDALVHLLRLRLISSSDRPSQFFQPFAQAESWISSTPEVASTLFMPKRGKHPWRRDIKDPPILPDFSAYGFRPPFEDSIFANITDTTTDPEHGSVTWYSWKVLGADVFIAGSMNISNHVVGNDKIGHFFWEGWEYWNLAKKSGTWLLEPAFAYGERTERTYFGKGEGISEKTTWGIYSYADLAANLSGLLFWHRLSSGAKPAIVCQGEKASVGNPFDIKDYVSPLWDQGINCSTYRPKVEAQILSKLNALKITCPVVPAECLKFSSHPLAERIANPECVKPRELEFVAPKTLPELSSWAFSE